MVPISFAYLARFTKGLGCDFKLSWHEQICKLCKVGMIWGDHQSPSCYYIVHTAHYDYYRAISRYVIPTWKKREPVVKFSLLTEWMCRGKANSECKRKNITRKNTWNFIFKNILKFLPILELSMYLKWRLKNHLKKCDSKPFTNPHFPCRKILKKVTGKALCIGMIAYNLTKSIGKVASNLYTQKVKTVQNEMICF